MLHTPKQITQVLPPLSSRSLSASALAQVLIPESCFHVRAPSLTFFQSGYMATLNYVMVAINEIWFSEENIFPVIFYV